jgi:hypothetical protein
MELRLDETRNRVLGLCGHLVSDVDCSARAIHWVRGDRDQTRLGDWKSYVLEVCLNGWGACVV